MAGYKPSRVAARVLARGQADHDPEGLLGRQQRRSPKGRVLEMIDEHLDVACLRLIVDGGISVM
jgi:hypothetical protein